MAAQIDASLQKSGEPIGIRDVFISAIAYTNKCTLITWNTKHSKKVTKILKDLIIKTPEDV